MTQTVNRSDASHDASFVTFAIYSEFPEKLMKCEKTYFSPINSFAFRLHKTSVSKCDLQAQEAKRCAKGFDSIYESYFCDLSVKNRSARCASIYVLTRRWIYFHEMMVAKNLTVVNYQRFQRITLITHKYKWNYWPCAELSSSCSYINYYIRTEGFNCESNTIYKWTL